MAIDLSAVREVDLGCGHDGGRVPSRLESGAQIVGVDLDLSANNLDTLMTEINLRVFTAAPDLFGRRLDAQANQLSVREYPAKLWKGKAPKAGLVLMDLKKSTIKALKETEDREMAAPLNESMRRIETVLLRRDLSAQRVKHRRFYLSQDEKNRMIEADAIEFLKTLPDEQIERIYADYFWWNAEAQQGQGLEICHQKISEEGCLEIVDGQEAIRDLLPKIKSKGFVLREDPTPVTDKELAGMSKRLKAFLLIAGEAKNTQGWRAVFQKDK